MNEENRVWGAMKCPEQWKTGIKAKKCLCERVIVPTALSGAEA